MIETARGAVADDSLGITLMHEHLCVLSDGVVDAFPRVFDRVAAADIAVEQVLAVAALGVGTIVDLTVMGQGRHIGVIADVAARVPVNIVAATGAYTFDQLPHYFSERPTDHLAEQFVADIEEGIAGTEIKAAVIKCSTDVQGVTEDVDKLLRATARASVATNALISTHTHAASRNGIDQLRIFADEGVDPARVVIGHSGDSDDIDYLLTLAASGAYLGMDRFGYDRIQPMDSRIQMVLELHRRGLGRQLLLSHDCCCHIDWFPKDSPVLAGLSMVHLLERVTPALRAAGLGDDAIDEMLIDNPRRALAGN
jgi:phosphotriesterase-related protein